MNVILNITKFFYYVPDTVILRKQHMHSTTVSQILRGP